MIRIARLACAAAFAALAFHSPAFADVAQDAAMAPVHIFIDGTNSGDMKAAAAAYAPSAAITDEFAPYHWRGAKAFAQWGADFGKWAKAAGATEPRIDLEPARRVAVTGTHAYAVVPARFSFKQDGATRSEQGTFTFALTKMAKGWRIASWSWTWVRDNK